MVRCTEMRVGAKTIRDDRHLRTGKRATAFCIPDFDVERHSRVEAKLSERLLTRLVCPKRVERESRVRDAQPNIPAAADSGQGKLALRVGRCRGRPAGQNGAIASQYRFRDRVPNAHDLDYNVRSRFSARPDEPTSELRAASSRSSTLPESSMWTGSVAGANPGEVARIVTLRFGNQVAKFSGRHRANRPESSAVVLARTESRRPRSPGPNGRRARAMTSAPDTGRPTASRTTPEIALRAALAGIGSAAAAGDRLEADWDSLVQPSDTARVQS